MASSAARETRGLLTSPRRGDRDAAAAAAAMALSNPCPGARSSAAIPPIRAATREIARRQPWDPPAVPGARAAEGRARRRGARGGEEGARGGAGRAARGGASGPGLPLSLSAACRLSAKRDLKGFACQLPEFHTRAVALNRGKAALSLIFFFFCGNSLDNCIFRGPPLFIHFTHTFTH